MAEYYNQYKFKCDTYDKNTNCIPILECGKIFDPNLPSKLSTNNTPVKLAEVTIDTRCLSKPCVKIEYSSIITTLALSGSSNTLSLKFRLSKKCKDEEEITLKEWDFKKSSMDSGEEDIKSFTVIFCECLDCLDKECFTYIMQLVEVIPSNANEVTYKINDKDILALGVCKGH
jgi:hypothetical protein